MSDLPFLVIRGLGPVSVQSVEPLGSGSGVPSAYPVAGTHGAPGSLGIQEGSGVPANCPRSVEEPSRPLQPLGTASQSIAGSVTTQDQVLTSRALDAAEAANRDLRSQVVSLETQRQDCRRAEESLKLSTDAASRRSERTYQECQGKVRELQGQLSVVSTHTTQPCPCTGEALARLQASKDDIQRQLLDLERQLREQAAMHTDQVAQWSKREAQMIASLQAALKAQRTAEDRAEAADLALRNGQKEWEAKRSEWTTLYQDSEAKGAEAQRLLADQAVEHTRYREEAETRVRSLTEQQLHTVRSQETVSVEAQELRKSLASCRAEVKVLETRAEAADLALRNGQKEWEAKRSEWTTLYRDSAAKGAEAQRLLADQAVEHTRYREEAETRVRSLTEQQLHTVRSQETVSVEAQELRQSLATCQAEIKALETRAEAADLALRNGQKDWEAKRSEWTTLYRDAQAKGAEAQRLLAAQAAEHTRYRQETETQVRLLTEQQLHTAHTQETVNVEAQQLRQSLATCQAEVKALESRHLDALAKLRSQHEAQVAQQMQEHQLALAARQATADEALRSLDQVRAETKRCRTDAETAQKAWTASQGAWASREQEFHAALSAAETQSRASALRAAEERSTLQHALDTATARVAELERSGREIRQQAEEEQTRLQVEVDQLGRAAQTTLAEAAKQKKDDAERHEAQQRQWTHEQQQLQEARGALERRRADTETRYRDLEGRLGKAQEERLAAQTSWATERRRFEAEAQNRQAELTELRRYNQDASERLALADGKTQEAKAAQAAAESKLRECSMRLDEAQKQAEAAAVRATETNRLCEASRLAETQAKEAETRRIVSLQSELKAAQDATAAAFSEAAVQRDRWTAQLQTTSAAAEAKWTEVNQRLAAVTTQRDWWMGKVRLLTKYQRECSKAEEDLAQYRQDCQRDLEAVRNQVRDLEAERTRILGDHEARIRDVDRLTLQVKELQDRETRLRERTRELEAQVASIQAVHAGQLRQWDEVVKLRAQRVAALEVAVRDAEAKQETMRTSAASDAALHAETLANCRAALVAREEALASLTQESTVLRQRAEAALSEDRTAKAAAAALGERVEETSGRLAQCRAELDRAQSSQRAAETLTQEARAETARLAAELRAASAQVTEVQDRLARQVSENAVLAAETKGAQEEARRLTEQLTLAQEARRAAEAAAQLAQLVTEGGGAGGTEAASRASELESQILDLQQQLQRVQAERTHYAECRDERSTLRDTLTRLRDQLETFERENDRIRGGWRRDQEALSARAAALDAEIRSSAQRLDIAQKQLAAQKHEVSELVAAAERCTARAEAAETQVRRLKEQLQTLRAQDEAETKRRAEELAQCRSTLESKSSETRAAKTAVSDLQERAEVAEAKSRDLENLVTELETTVRTQKEALAREEAARRSYVIEAENQAAELARCLGQRATDAERLSQAQAATERLRSRAEAAEALVKETEEKLSQETERTSTCEESLTRAKTDAGRFQELLSKLLRKVQVTDSDLFHSFVTEAQQAT